MNEKTARQIAEMKNQTIGVEVEMNNITRQKAAKVAADFFGTGRFENTAGRNGYSTWSAWDAQGREWKFQKDVSIAGPDEQKCELVTPILNYGDIETLQELCRQLRHAGAKSDASRGCGVQYKGIRTGKRRTVNAFAYIMHEERPIGIPTNLYMRTCLEGYDTFYFDKNILIDAYDKCREVCGYEG